MYVDAEYIYFRFGLVNAINYYSRLKIRVVSVGNFNLKCLIIELIKSKLTDLFCIP